MSATGLIPSQQTRPNVTDEYYLRKGQPIVGPVNIVGASLRLTNTATPSTSYIIYNNPEDGGGLIAGDFQIFGYGPTGPREVLHATPDGSSLIVGDATVVGGADLSVNGPDGPSRVNDPIYNPATLISVPNMHTTGQTLTAGSGVFATQAVIAPGLYQLQCEINMSNAGTFAIPVGGSLNFYLALAAGTGSVEWSEISITTAMLAQPGAGTSSDPTYTSAIFTIADNVNRAIAYEAVGNWDFGTGGLIKFNLVKLG
jgi:hypothetical protein